MSEVPVPEPSAFAKSLVDAGRADKPSALVRAHALARLEAVGVFAGFSATIPVWVAVGIAAAAAVAIGAFVHARGTSLRAEAPKPANVAETTASARPGPKAPEPAPGTHAAQPVTCETVNLPDEPPTLCSEEGRIVALELVNTCSDTVDVFWVDYKCRETFTQRLAPGETMRHRTYDTHPWRVRDHRTRRLIKEWVGPRLPDVPEGPVKLKDIVITDRSTAEDVPPVKCSRPSRPATVRFVNDRASGVSVVFWVDGDCKESIERRMDPGTAWESKTSIASAWRVRDEKGELLVDYVPDIPDETVYVSLP
jgi:hypothetical protein